jgi:hypothetical protein
MFAAVVAQWATALPPLLPLVLLLLPLSLCQWIHTAAAIAAPWAPLAVPLDFTGSRHWLLKSLAAAVGELNITRCAIGNGPAAAAATGAASSAPAAD